jgi:hypothetical protein
MTHQPTSTMVLNTEWTQLETIELLCETSGGGGGGNATTISSTSQTGASASGKSLGVPTGMTSSPSGCSISGSGSGGFGFGITGNKSTGVVVKAITSSGSAQKVSSRMLMI